mmetsp:Transcript_42380/g.111634  ORF Transcript_42380/g.111634 Transcript_42380/m.111634 type:complete len:340 (+) Transcript_42380:29-1048(+)
MSRPPQLAAGGVYDGNTITQTEQALTLYVSSIPEGVSFEALEGLFKDDVGFLSARPVGTTKRRLAFIDFETIRDATLSMRMHQGYKFPGTKAGIRIDYDKDKRQKRNAAIERDWKPAAFEELKEIVRAAPKQPRRCPECLEFHKGKNCVFHGIRKLPDKMELRVTLADIRANLEQEQSQKKKARLLSPAKVEGPVQGPALPPPKAKAKPVVSKALPKPKQLDNLLGGYGSESESSEDSDEGPAPAPAAQPAESAQPAPVSEAVSEVPECDIQLSEESDIAEPSDLLGVSKVEEEPATAAPAADGNKGSDSGSEGSDGEIVVCGVRVTRPGLSALVRDKI